MSMPSMQCPDCVAEQAGLPGPLAPTGQLDTWYQCPRCCGLWRETTNDPEVAAERLDRIRIMNTTRVWITGGLLIIALTAGGAANVFLRGPLVLNLILAVLAMAVGVGMLIRVKP